MATISKLHGASAAQDTDDTAFTVVMKFGGTSVASAERMRALADLLKSFPEERPVVTLSAMGKTTNNLLSAGEAALECASSNDIVELESYRAVVDLATATADELGVDAGLITPLLDDLRRILQGVSLMKELTPRTRDYLVSFGERMSVRLFAAYLESEGMPAQHFDAWDIGFVSTDDFMNGDIMPETYERVHESLNAFAKERPGAVAVVTGFLAHGKETGAITTLGRGGSDLTATVIGAALGVREVQVWKDVDGVLTADPRLVAHAEPVPFLTFDEATELAYFGATVLHPQSMQPAMAAGMPVRVKNSYRPEAEGTLIVSERDMGDRLLTSVVRKKNVTMLDIQSTRMLGQYGFLAKVFGLFDQQGISVDVVATSEISVSLTLDPAKIWHRELISQELESLTAAFEGIATVNLLRDKSIISLICNVSRSSEILEKVFSNFAQKDVNVQMISQGASKVNISLIVDDDEAEACIHAVHDAFYPQA
eukprot:PRCOL_00002438-RA